MFRALGSLWTLRSIAACFAAAALAAGSAAQAAQIFFEDFSDNSAGWMLDGAWEIGPAMSSSPSGVGFPDPAFDHTPTDDNGVAGVAIGGNIPLVTNNFHWLTSPAINAAVPGAVILGYHRWLNTDMYAYIMDHVDVYNGLQWVTLWTNSFATLTTDNSWNLFQFDVTAYKNEEFRVRFGYSRIDNGAFVMSGWNVDDVSLEAPEVLVIPEPHTYALLLAGLGLLGFAARRRRRSTLEIGL